MSTSIFPFTTSAFVTEYFVGGIASNSAFTSTFFSGIVNVYVVSFTVVTATSPAVTVFTLYPLSGVTVIVTVSPLTAFVLSTDTFPLTAADTLTSYVRTGFSVKSAE